MNLAGLPKVAKMKDGRSLATGGKVDNKKSNGEEEFEAFRGQGWTGLS